MKQQIPPGVMAGIIGVVVVLLALVGYSRLSGGTGGAGTATSDSAETRKMYEDRDKMAKDPKFLEQARKSSSLGGGPNPGH
jgi:hypothetical protein